MAMPGLVRVGVVGRVGHRSSGMELVGSRRGSCRELGALFAVGRFGSVVSR